MSLGAVEAEAERDSIDRRTGVGVTVVDVLEVLIGQVATRGVAVGRDRIVTEDPDARL